MNAGTIPRLQRLAAMLFSPRQITALGGALALVSAIYIVVLRVVQRHRARLPRMPKEYVGLRLTTPTWVLVGPSAHVLLSGGLAMCVAGILGYPKLGMVIAAAVLLLSVFSYFFTGTIGVTAIQISPAGIRGYVGQASIFVRWKNVEAIDQWGNTPHRSILVLRIKDRQEVVDSLTPNTARTRSRLDTVTLSAAGLTLRPWLGGVDSRSLEHLMRQAQVMSAKADLRQ